MPLRFEVFLIQRGQRWDEWSLPLHTKWQFSLSECSRRKLLSLSDPWLCISPTFMNCWFNVDFRRFYCSMAIVWQLFGIILPSLCLKLRVILLMMLAVCMNGTFLLEQPGNTLLEYYTRFRDFLTMLRETIGDHAVPCYLNQAAVSTQMIHLDGHDGISLIASP